MNNKILILCAKLNIGGAQLAAANISRFSRGRFRCHYIVYGDEVGEYEQEILDRGDEIFHYPSPKRDYPGFLRRLYAQMKRERYLAVHCHTLHSCGLVMPTALLARIPCRISHSHTTALEGANSLPRRLYSFAMRTLIRLCSTEYLACGVQAGAFLYGRRWFQARGKVLSNGIDFRKFAFSAEARSQLREALGLENRFVIGHAGHCESVKNQMFLIELMPRILARRPDALLYLCGEGSERENYLRRAAELGLSDRIRLPGNVADMHRMLSVFDVFAFPSLFEGTPYALIEAQANGLSCIISDGIPDDACLTTFRRLSLSAPPERWVEAICSAGRIDSDEAIALLSRRYDDVHASMEQLYRIYDQYRGE